MRPHLAFFAAILSVLITFRSNAQQGKPMLPGSVKGILRDTVHLYVLKSATVSVYKAADSTLLNYQVSNNYGEFSFKNLPTAVLLRVEVSNVGYQTFNRNFTISAPANFLDLKTLSISPRDITLKEVVITIPPIRMNGDTLEFNAAAFKLDSNAVVEDLLKKIPNITLWGDGQITVNGKEIKSLLVNGKTFFGNDPKVATQNIAKNALEKIQVYNVNEDKEKPLDSVLYMNLKLKKGKDIGYFGKIGGGYGTNNRFEGDASFNIFSPKMQLAFIAAGNNINKTANSIQTLIANSTFKGAGTSIDYQPDFRTSGINRTNTGGVDFTYNFIEKPTYNHKKVLKSSYFIQNRNYDNLSKTETTSLLNNADRIFDKNKSNNSTSSTNQVFKTNYDWSNLNQILQISQSTIINNGLSNNTTSRTAENAQNVLTSANNSFDKTNYNSRNFVLNADYRLSQNYLKPNPKFKGFRVNYNLTIFDNKRDRDNVTEFKSYVNAATNRNFNRNYETSADGINQKLDFELNNVKSYLFGKAKLAGIDFSISNNLSIANSNDNNEVADLNTATNSYEKNIYLSNQVQTDLIEEMPGINFNRTFSKSLSNRYNKRFYITIAAKQKFVYQNFTSEKSIQHIKRTFSRFTPSANFSYSDSQQGEYFRSYSLSFNTNLKLPTLNQLAPLIDSTEVYTLRKGNINLSEAVDRVISFYFNHSDLAKKNTLNYNLNATGGFVDNGIVDSVFIDQQNRQTIFAINASGSKYLNLYGNIQKAYKLKTGELKLRLNTSLNLSKTPGYINGVFNFAENRNISGSLNINYSLKGLFSVEFKQSISNYQSRRLSFNNATYSGTNLSSTISSIYNVTKQFSLNSNLAFNTSKSQNAKDINFTIWNATATYRFLKGNNAEFKLSALDLLHQNNSVINYGYGNSFTVGTQNVLQQYFMTTFSYYPRKFGKK
ncbi:MAG: hypothetical protein V4541_00090 [Bacteroidota bacterium]